MPSRPRTELVSLLYPQVIHVLNNSVLLVVLMLFLDYLMTRDIDDSDSPSPRS